jgi:hypothetical protein
MLVKTAFLTMIIVTVIIFFTACLGNGVNAPHEFEVATTAASLQTQETVQPWI